MKPGLSLEEAVRSDVAHLGAPSEAVAAAILGMAEAAISLSDLIARPALSGRLGAASGSVNSDGDGQRRLDLMAEDLFRDALAAAGVGPYLSEEIEGAAVLDPSGAIAVAIDPLDGSSNIDVDAPIGTIFSILPALGPGEEALASFRQSGRVQLAGGFFIYGPQTALALTFGKGTRLFTLDPATRAFVLVEAAVQIPAGGREYAINASNQRHWHPPVQRFIADCAAGAEGPLGHNFNTRWVASLVADAYRILIRGGVFLYPRDRRPGYEEGRLRLLYEVNPVAFLIEQAGGAATDGLDPILDRIAAAPHQRAPLIMGSTDHVERVRSYHRV